MSEVTRIISRIESGDRTATEELLPLVYQELRRLAESKLAHEKPGQTLQATALVHEAYVRLVDQPNPQDWENSRHFFAAAAEAMRRILIEQARQKASIKREGGQDWAHDGQPLVWDVSGIEPSVHTRVECPETVRSVAYSADGDLIEFTYKFSAGVVRVLNAQAYEKILEIPAQANKVYQHLVPFVNLPTDAGCQYI